ncbi:MAG TPA: Hsp20/alpha crystallin family protein [Candidatus Paceibacterota bacterium]
MAKGKRSFFERLTGTMNVGENRDSREEEKVITVHQQEKEWVPEEDNGEEGQLAVDVYQTPEDIVIKTMVAGVRPDDLDISITRDMVTIKGTREAANEVTEDNFFFKELYWGTFTRTIVLPQEIEVEGAEAVEKHGLLIIRLPKVDKGRQTKLRVKAT